MTDKLLLVCCLVWCCLESRLRQEENSWWQTGNKRQTAGIAGQTGTGQGGQSHASGQTDIFSGAQADVSGIRRLHGTGTQQQDTGGVSNAAECSE